MRWKSLSKVSFRAFKAYLFVPAGVLVFGLTVTGVVWHIARNAAEEEAHLRFETRASEIEALIETRLKSYEQVLRGVAGLFAASRSVVREEFRVYTDLQRLSENYPGIQGVGFAQWIAPAEKLSTEAAIRAEGFPDFRIWPPGDRPAYSSIVLLEPLSGRNLRAFGYDMYSEPIRREAMDRAMLQGQTAVTEKVKLVQETETDVQPGFLMYVPVYHLHRPHNTPEERRNNLLGWAYAPFRAHDFMQGILGSQGEVADSLDLDLLDDSGVSLFDSGPNDRFSGGSVRVAERTIAFGGRSWKMILRGSAGSGAPDRSLRNTLILISGISASMLLSLLVWLILGRRERDEAARQIWINSTAMDGFCLLDGTGQIVQTNEAACTLTGFSSEELRTMQMQRLIPEIESSWNPQGTDAARFEAALSRKNGSRLSVEVSTRSMQGENRRVVFIRDVTQKLAAERALRESESRFRNLVESLREIVYTLDTEGRHTGLYGSWVEKAGRRPEDFLGKTARDMFGPEAAKVHEEALARALKGEFVVYEWSMGPSFFETSLSPLWLSGEITGVVGIGRDVTERERLKDAVERNEKLRSLGDLAGGIAHDFNNLLGGIFGHIEAAASISGEPEVKRILARASGTIDRARKLTAQLLTFSHAGTPDLRSHNVQEFLERSVHFSLTGSGMKAVFNFPPEPLHAVFDREQIEQVVDNLVINARQACSDSGILEVSAQSVEIGADNIEGLAAGSYVRAAFRDSGPGISNEVREHLFDPFFSTKGPGRGLGLATSYSILRRHGGVLDAEAAERGASLYFLLPSGRAPEAPASAEPAEDRVLPAGLRILVMDDEIAMRESLAELLALRGFSVDEAASGEEALAKIETSVNAGDRYAALIADLTVPGGMGGLELARAGRAADERLPVVLMSGYSPGFSPDEMKERGICAVLAKPFSMNEISRVIRDCVPED